MLYNDKNESEDEIQFFENLNDEDYENSFYCAIKPALKVGKVFGLFPININSKQPHEISFKWLSFRTAISIIFIIWSVLTTVSAFMAQLRKGELTPSNIVGIIFFGICCVISIIFFRIAGKFRILMMHWAAVERIFASEKYNFPQKRWKLKKRISVFLWGFLIGAFLEHAFYLITEIYKLHFEVKHCNITVNDNTELFITRHLHFILTNIPIKYNHPYGIVVEFLNVSITFWWNYLDLFIILISIGLAELFEKITYRMTCLKAVAIGQSVWAELRSHHVQVSELIIVVNKVFGIAFMIACCNDGYFILIQMLNITTSLPFLISVIYFWFSLSFLVLRAALMILFASQVHENAKEPISVIREIPTEHWCSELQRFFDQIKVESSSNCLSGKNFFFLNKRLLFSIAGALITYELVLIQFDGEKINWEDIVDCNEST